MKQMRSRFRLITLLLACAFLLTLVLCTGNALKTAGITLPSLSGLPGAGPGSPSPSVLPGGAPGEETTPSPSVIPSDTLPDTSGVPETDNSPEPEYNIFGL